LSDVGYCGEIYVAQAPLVTDVLDGFNGTVLAYVTRVSPHLHGRVGAWARGPSDCARAFWQPLLGVGRLLSIFKNPACGYLLRLSAFIFAGEMPE
jgi:hypothetical protein